MKLLGTVSAALFIGAMLAAAPALAQHSGGFGGSVAAAAAPGTVSGSFQVGAGRGGRGGRGWSDGEWRDPRPDRRDPRDRWARRGWYGYGIASGGAIDRDGGYFAEGAEAPAVSNGQVDYAYDRGYPYDHFGSKTGRMADAAHSRGHGSGERFCETEWTRDRRTRQQVSVRVCRN
jgi:hypothetical protein